MTPTEARDAARVLAKETGDPTAEISFLIWTRNGVPVCASLYLRGGINIRAEGDSFAAVLDELRAKYRTRFTDIKRQAIDKARAHLEALEAAP